MIKNNQKRTVAIEMNFKGWKGEDVATTVWNDSKPKKFYLITEDGLFTIGEANKMLTFLHHLSTAKVVDIGEVEE